MQGYKATLYLGTDIPFLEMGHLAKVTQTMLDQFLKVVVAPKFDGYTLTHGTGYYKGDIEDVYLLTILSTNPPEGTLTMYMLMQAFEKQIREVADEYRKTFMQNSVLYDIHAVGYAFSEKEKPDAST